MNSEKTNIKLIVAGCLDHNQASEKRLFELFYGYVRSVCSRYAKNNQEADEMLNDTFYSAFRYLDRYDSSYDFKPWIRKVCINCCLQYLKKYEVRYSMVDVENIESIDLPIAHVDEIEGSVLLTLIKELSPAYRMVFNLYVFEEYKHSEIAEMLNISIGSSKSNLSKAKSKLEELIMRYRANNKKTDKAYG